MLTDEKRNFIKAQSHLIELCDIISRLQDEVMPPRRYAETMLRLQKRAQLAAQRIGKIASENITMADRMDFHAEESSPYHQNMLNN